MNRLVAVILAALAAAGSLGLAATPAVAATPPKVVVIVGPAGSMTAAYRSEAEAIAAEARRWTSDVTTLLSPNATWELAKPALQGANVVVYLGHGNGFPSPYSSTLLPATQDGLGLNPYAGSGDSTTRYWGEAYLAAEVRLAPGALVLLHHLCYASGNSEPGRGEPTIDVAQQRVDNMAAGWSAAGAGAVIADAHRGSVYYMNALFATSQTLDSLWRVAPGANWNLIPFQSVRTPGRLGQLDPETPTTGFYRSFLGDPSLTTDAVRGATASDPLPPADPALGAPVVPAPPDVVPPTLVPVGNALAPVTFSPNGDGVGESIALPLALGESGLLEVAIAAEGGGPVRAWSLPVAPGRTTVTWDGRDDAGAVVPDGRYLASVTARDAAGNAAPPLQKRIAVHTALAGVAVSLPAIWPADPNGTAPRATEVSFTLATAATVSVAILDAAGRTVATIAPRAPRAAGFHAVAWDGTGADGSPVAPGTYRASVVAASGGLATRVGVPVGVGPFALVPGRSVAVRGSILVLTASAAGPVAAPPVVRIVQPGLAARSVRMVLEGDRWVARIPVLRGGTAGRLSIAVAGTDLLGLRSVAQLSIPLR